MLFNKCDNLFTHASILFQACEWAESWGSDQWLTLSSAMVLGHEVSRAQVLLAAIV